MRVTRIVLFVAAGLLAGACVPETEHFLSEPGKLDKRLLGTWYFNNRNGNTTLLDIRAGTDKRFGIVWLDFRPGKTLPDKTRKDYEAPARWLRYTGFTTRLDGRRYINLQLINARWPRKAPKRFIMRYWLSKKGQLRIAFMSTKIVRQAIKSGKLAGRDAKYSTLITASRKSLIAFIRKHGPAAFNKPSLPVGRLRVGK